MALQEHTPHNEENLDQKENIINNGLDGLFSKISETCGVSESRFYELANIKARGDIIELQEELDNLPITNKNDREFIEDFYLSESTQKSEVDI
jgi:hypothetical protein